MGRFISCELLHEGACTLPMLPVSQLAKVSVASCMGHGCKTFKKLYSHFWLHQLSSVTAFYLKKNRGKVCFEQCCIRASSRVRIITQWLICPRTAMEHGWMKNGSPWRRGNNIYLILCWDAFLKYPPSIPSFCPYCKWECQNIWSSTEGLCLDYTKAKACCWC